MDKSKESLTLMEQITQKDPGRKRGKKRIHMGKIFSVDLITGRILSIMDM